MIVIGIDFGHGEVAASYADFSAEDKTPYSLNLSKLSTQNKYQRVAPSIIYRVPRENGEYEYSIDAESDIVIKIKGKIDNNEERLEAFREFIKQIYDRLLRMNKMILTGDDDQLKEIMLYIAAPTKWSAEEQYKYKTFIEDALGRNVEWIINESDAAFYCNKSDGCVLVIDYGSSTIDYTLMIDNKKVDIDNLSNQLGASEIEHRVLTCYKRTEDYNYKYERTRDVQRLEDLEFIEPDNLLEYHFRKDKEKYYSLDDRDDFDSKFNACLRITKNESYKSAEYAFIYENCNIDNLIVDYKKTVENDLLALKEEICKRLRDIPLNRIILTGGAARMDWFQETVGKVFAGTNILHDNDNASHVVSDGIVKYAVDQLKCLGKIYEEFEKFRNVDNINYNYKYFYNKVRKDAIRPFIKEPLKVVCEEYANSPTDDSVQIFIDKIKDCFEKTINNNHFQDYFNHLMKDTLFVHIYPIIDRILVEWFNITTENITKYYTTSKLDLKCQSFDRFYHNLVDWFKGAYMSNDIKQVRVEEFGALEAKWDLNLTKRRKPEMRRALADKFYKYITEEEVDFGLSVSENFYIEEKMDILESYAKTCAKEILYRNDLFKTQSYNQ